MRIDGFKKLGFLSWPFWIFCLIPMKIGQWFLGNKVWSKFIWLPWFPAKNHPHQTFLVRVYYRLSKYCLLSCPANSKNNLIDTIFLDFLLTKGSNIYTFWDWGLLKVLNGSKLSLRQFRINQNLQRPPVSRAVYR